MGRDVVTVQDPVAAAPLLRAMSARSVTEALQDCSVGFLIYRLSSRDVLMMNQSVSVKEHNQHGLDFTCRTLFGRGDDAVFHWEDICIVSRSYPQNQHLSPVITEDMKLRSFWARSLRSVQIDAQLSFCSAVRRWGANFAVTRLICKSSVRNFWHILNAVLTSSATSLIDIDQRE